MFSQQTLRIRNPFSTSGLTASTAKNGVPLTADEFAQFLVNATASVKSRDGGLGVHPGKRDNVSFACTSEPDPQLSVLHACHDDMACVTWPHGSRTPMNASVPSVGEAIVVSSTSTRRGEKHKGGRARRCSVCVEYDGGAVAHAIEQPRMDGVVWISAANITRSSWRRTTVCTLVHPSRELHCFFQHPACTATSPSTKASSKGTKGSSDAAQTSSLHIPRGTRVLNESGKKKDGEVTRTAVDSLLRRSLASWIVARMHVAFASVRAAGVVPFISKEEILSRFPYLHLFSGESQLRIIQSALHYAPIGPQGSADGGPAPLVYRGGKVLCLYQSNVSAQFLLSQEERLVVQDVERCLSELQDRCAGRVVEVSRAIHTILHAWNKSSIPSRSSSLRLVVLKYFCILARCGCLDARTPKWRMSVPIYRAMGLLTFLQGVHCSRCHLHRVVQRLNDSIGVAAVDVFKDGRKRSVKPEQLVYRLYDAIITSHYSHQDVATLSSTSHAAVVRGDAEGSSRVVGGGDAEERDDMGDEEDMLQPSSFFASSVHPSVEQPEPLSKEVHVTSYDSLSAGLLQASTDGAARDVKTQHSTACLLELPKAYGAKHVASKECMATQFHYSTANATVESALAVGSCPVCGTLREARRHVNPLCPLYWLRVCVGGDCRLSVAHPCFAEEWVHGGASTHGALATVGGQASSLLPMDDEDSLQLTLFTNRNPGRKRRQRESDEEIIEADMRAFTSVRRVSRQRDGGVAKRRQGSSTPN